MKPGFVIPISLQRSSLKQLWPVLLYPDQMILKAGERLNSHSVKCHY